VFNGKNEIIQEITYNLMVRAADSLSISNKKDMEGSIKKLGDKVAEVEKEKAEMKGDWA